MVAGLAVWGVYSKRLEAKSSTPRGSRSRKNRIPESCHVQAHFAPSVPPQCRRGPGRGRVATGAVAASKLGFTVAKFAAPKTVSWWDRPAVDLATAGRNDWLSQVGSTFSLQSETGNVTMKLAKVTALPAPGARPRGLRDQAFALAFEPVGGAMPEGDRIYSISHSGADLKVYFAESDKVLLAVFDQRLEAGGGFGRWHRAAAPRGRRARHLLSPGDRGRYSVPGRVYASTRAEELAMTGWPDEMKLQFIAHQFNAQHTDYERNYPDAERLVIRYEGEDVGRLYLDEESSNFNLIDIALLPAARGKEPAERSSATSSARLRRPESR